jgi:hypothetical protein
MGCSKDDPEDRIAIEPFPITTASWIENARQSSSDRLLARVFA